MLTLNWALKIENLENVFIPNTLFSINQLVHFVQLINVQYRSDRWQVRSVNNQSPKTAVVWWRVDLLRKGHCNNLLSQDLIYIGLYDRLKETILKPWKGALSSHSVCVSVCLSVNGLQGTPFELGTKKKNICF